MSRKSKEEPASRPYLPGDPPVRQAPKSSTSPSSRSDTERGWWWKITCSNLVHSVIVAISCVVFSLWTQDIAHPWGQLLFGAEAAIQALLALSGFIHYSTRKTFSYAQHHPIATIVLRALVIMHHLIRIIIIFNPEYTTKIPVILGLASTILSVAAPVRVQRLFATLVLVNLVMAIKMWNLWAILYSVNIFLVALSKHAYPSALAEIVNIGIWYGIKVTGFKS
ncbi:hypothetical protein SeLEV6574_g05862 [Synchytrium endobioticum]|nr:hypothetical protein SeLEV6574_g05862 [Synchytrium endobioticum]